MTNERINQHLEKFLNFLLFKVTGLLLIVFLVVAIPLSHSNAASATVAFGGKVGATVVCTCPAVPGIMITVAGVKGGSYFWSLTTTHVYSFGNVTPKAAIKGLAFSTPVQCWQVDPAGPGCVPSGLYGLPIDKFGTGLR